MGVAPPLDLDVVSRLQLSSALIDRHRYRLSCAHRGLVVLLLLARSLLGSWMKGAAWWLRFLRCGEQVVVVVVMVGLLGEAAATPGEY